jgi:hypothetical protein
MSNDDEMDSCTQVPTTKRTCVHVTMSSHARQ